MGLENLIMASKILVSEGYQFRTFIGGSGPLRSNLEGKVAEYGLENTVYLLGKIPENKLSLSYAAADCFVLPTRSLECFGLIVLEAYASGTPVIATPIGSIPEVMGNGFHEWLAADITAEALALQMRSFLRGELICDDSLLRRHAEQYRDSTILSRLEKIVMGKSASH
jgi:glycosyltransferase involved in cell wall biosynthesis